MCLLLIGACKERCLQMCQRAIDIVPPSLGSLATNQLCGINRRGDGTYTAEGITKLCEGLKGSAVTSLECAAAPKCLLLCQRPLTRLLSHRSHPAPRTQP